MSMTLRRGAADMAEEATEAHSQLLAVEETELGSQLSARDADCHRDIRKSLIVAILKHRHRYIHDYCN